MTAKTVAVNKKKLPENRYLYVHSGSFFSTATEKDSAESLDWKSFKNVPKPEIFQTFVFIPQRGLDLCHYSIGGVFPFRKICNVGTHR